MATASVMQPLAAVRSQHPAAVQATSGQDEGHRGSHCWPVAAVTEGTQHQRAAPSAIADPQRDRCP